MAPWVVALVAVTVFALSAGGVELIRRWAERSRVLDLPGERSSHTAPTPRGGGLAIVLVTVLAAAVIVLAGRRPSGLAPIWLAVGVAIVAGVSWLDDLRSLPTVVRLAAHVAAAGVAIAGLGWLERVDVPLAPVVLLGGGVGVAVTVIWVVGLTNAYNFMDGIDGIAGGQAVVAGLGWFALGGEPAIRVLGVIIAAASVGFLVHNWQPARIFMGDVGSAFLGYAFAVIPLAASHRDPRLAFAGVLLVWPFVFDTTFTLLRRLRRGENVFVAHRSHLYQRLVIAGWQHRTVSLLYTALAALGAGLAMFWLRGGTVGPPLAAAGVVLGALGLWVLVGVNERRTRPARGAARP